MAKRREVEPPHWIKLDNAAKIYPPSRSRSWAAMFRLSVTLTERVDPEILEKALAATVKRLPSFAYRLRRGVFWYYFDHLSGAPILQADVANPLVAMDLAQNDHFLFRVRYYERRIAVEFFHALTDGTGGLTFISTMTAEYLRLKYGLAIPAGGPVLDVRERPAPEEIEDSFLKYARKAALGRVEKSAYHVRGELGDPHLLRVTTGLVPVAELTGKARACGVSVTVLIASVLIKTILTLQQKELSPIRRRQMVKVSVPVNLRPFYGARTMRNFASYVNVGVESALGEYTLEEIMNHVKHQFGLEITEKRLNARFSGNVNSEKLPIIRAMPLFIKSPFLKMMYLLQGDRYCSTTLSNLGRVVLPEPMRAYVSRMDFMLGAPGSTPSVCGVISQGDTVCITFSRLMREPALEHGFFTALIKLGIPVKVESNQR
ncbi:MAG: hypothetical protein RR452_06150 [Clostridia bacterium]